MVKEWLHALPLEVPDEMVCLNIAAIDGGQEEKLLKDILPQKENF